MLNKYHKNKKTISIIIIFICCFFAINYSYGSEKPPKPYVITTMELEGTPKQREKEIKKLLIKKDKLAAKQLNLDNQLKKEEARILKCQKEFDIQRRNLEKQLQHDFDIQYNLLQIEHDNSANNLLDVSVELLRCEETLNKLTKITKPKISELYDSNKVMISSKSFCYPELTDIEEETSKINNISEQTTKHVSFSQTDDNFEQITNDNVVSGVKKELEAVQSAQLDKSLQLDQLKNSIQGPNVQTSELQITNNIPNPLYELQEQDITFINNISKLPHIYEQNLNSILVLFMNSDNGKGSFFLTPMDKLNLAMNGGYLLNNFRNTNKEYLTLNKDINKNTKPYNSNIYSNYIYFTASYDFSNLIRFVGILGYQNIDFVFNQETGITNNNNLLFHSFYSQFNLQQAVNSFFDNTIVKIGYLGSSTIGSILKFSVNSNNKIKLNEGASFDNYMIFILGKKEININKIFTIEPNLGIFAKNFSFNNLALGNNENTAQYISINNPNKLLKSINCRIGINFKFLLYSLSLMPNVKDFINNPLNKSFLIKNNLKSSLTKVEVFINTSIDIPLLNKKDLSYTIQNINNTFFEKNKKIHSLFKSEVSTGLLFTFFNRIEIKLNGNVGLNNSLLEYGAKINFDLIF